MERTNKPKPIKTTRYKFWTKRIESMLNDQYRQYGHEALSNIKETIEKTGKVTDKQVRAIKNIQNGKNPITND